MKREIEPAIFNQLIDILAKDVFDARAMCLRLAKEFPEMFVTFATGTIEPENKEYMTVVKHIVDGAKVSAIKELRALSGTGLKEAKDVVDNIHNILIQNCILPSPEYPYQAGSISNYGPVRVAYEKMRETVRFMYKV
jgi:hypothetical protein